MPVYKVLLSRYRYARMLATCYYTRSPYCCCVATIVHTGDQLPDPRLVSRALISREARVSHFAPRETTEFLDLFEDTNVSTATRVPLDFSLGKSTSMRFLLRAFVVCALPAAFAQLRPRRVGVEAMGQQATLRRRPTAARPARTRL